MNMTILIIEDERKLVDILTRALKGERYSVESAIDGQTGYEKASKNNYELIILDLMLPKKDGLTICNDLRHKGIHTPIIMLTAKGTVQDRITGLNMGADDYLIKPFGMEELFARVRAVLRRRKTTDPDILKISDLVMDKVKHEVTRAGKKIDLTPKEYKLLNTMLVHRGEAMSRKKLIADVWSSDFQESNNELNVHIRYLRRKIDKGGKKPLVHTVRGVGFMIKE
jgi:DNA-binding response OmpR family regulator